MGTRIDRLVHQFQLLDDVHGQQAVNSICNHVNSIVNELITEIEASKNAEIDDDFDKSEFGENYDSDCTLTDNSSVSDWTSN